MTDLQTTFEALWSIPECERENGIKLLSKLLLNIVNNPSQTEKYGTLNFGTILEKFENCQPALDLLFYVGFKISTDGTQLQWTYNDGKLESLKIIYNILQHNVFPNIRELIMSGFSFSEALTAFDLSITNRDENSFNKQALFKTEQSSCFGKNVDEFKIEHCDYINRLMRAIQYYASNPSLFGVFCSYEYKQLLNDYIHFISIHSRQIEKINAQLVNNNTFRKCYLNKCEFVRRHYRQNGNRNIDMDIKEHENDERLAFYSQIMDGLHHYLFHLFDLGLRVRKSNEKYLQLTRRKPSNLDTVVGYIENARKKYTLGIHTNSHSKTNDAADNKQFVDSLFEYLSQQGEFSAQCQLSFHKLVTEEEFDTDAIIEDVEIYGMNSSNILYHTHNHKLFNTVKEYIVDTKLSASFNIGIIWFYWPAFQNKTTTSHLEQSGMKPFSNDFGGYAISNLYVIRKYNSYKMEILESRLVSIELYRKRVLFKANAYMRTKKVKSMRMWGDRASGGYLKYYGINPNQPISTDHIISIILYCDFSDYCTKFSSTFRRIKPFEPLESIKRRNRSFWWQSKLLREAVEIYGKTNLAYTLINMKKQTPDHELANQVLNAGRMEDSQYDEQFKNSESGPFYVGINRVMYIPQCYLYLGSPTSTSVDVEVSINFGTRAGMVIQLNNNYYEAQELPFFDCSWISRYGEENERLFFGGYDIIIVESVILLDSKQDYEQWFHALGLLDGLFSGSLGLFTWPGAEKNAPIDIMTAILKLAMKQLKESEFDSYNASNIKLYFKRKTTVHIQLAMFDSLQCTNGVKFQNITKLLFSPQGVCTTDDYPNYRTVNLISPIIFKLFPNVKEIVIYTTYIRLTATKWMFNILYFLEVISTSTHWTKIVIKAHHHYPNCDNFWKKRGELYKNPNKIALEKLNHTHKYQNIPSWLFQLWNAFSSNIKGAYAQKNYTIDLTHIIDHTYANFIVDCYTIERG
eukprot:292997_1